MQINHVRPAWAEVDLDLLQHNLKEISRVAGADTAIMAVVKANAYGHGAVECARVAVDTGVKYLGVAVGLEALELRAAGIKTPILVLGYTPAEQAPSMVANDIDVTVFDLEPVLALSAAAAKAGKSAKVHLKVETGMSRLGIPPGEALDKFLETIKTLPNVKLTGVFTHFAASDEDHDYTNRQFDLFREAMKSVNNKGFASVLRHSANSAAIMDFPHTYLDIVRPGLVMYGFYPSDRVTRRADIKPVLSLKARIAHIRQASAGETIGYARTYKTSAPTLVATLPIGYADGYDRGLSNTSYVLVKGTRAPVLGRVCMDQMMVDVTNVPEVKVGDVAVLMGEQSGDSITADDLARMVQTIPHELLTKIGKRVPRVYRYKGQTYLVDPLTGERNQIS